MIVGDPHEPKSEDFVIPQNTFLLEPMISTEPTISEAEPILVATKTSRNYAEFFAQCSEAEIWQELDNVVDIEKKAGWGIGDGALELIKRRKAAISIEASEIRQCADECSKDSDGIKAARNLRERADKLEATEIKYRQEIANRLGIHPQHLTNCVAQCLAFPPNGRPLGLLWKHFEVVLRGVGGVEQFKNKKIRDQAFDFLAHAVEKNLEPAQLREHICKSNAIFHPPTQPTEVNQYQELDDADALAIQLREVEITPEEAFYFRTRLLALKQLLDRIWAIPPP